MRPAGFNDIYLDNMVTITFLLTLRTRQIKRKQYSCHPSNKSFLCLRATRRLRRFDH